MKALRSPASHPPSRRPEPRPQAPRDRVALAALAAAVLLAYCNTLRNPFVFDDRFTIVENPHIRSLQPLGHALTGPAGSGANGRPLVAMSLAVNYALGGLDVFGYHIFNLLVHGLASWTLFAVARRTFASVALRPCFGGTATALGFTVALLWALHPLHTAAIDHLTYRNELMMGLFYLLTLYGLIRSADSAHPRRWNVAAVVACLLGVASKEVIVTAPLLGLLYDRTFLAGSFRAALRRRWALYLGLAATWVPLAILAGNSQRGASVGTHIENVAPLDYARTQIAVVAHYLRLVFWPDRLRIDSYWRLEGTLRPVLPQALVLGALSGATLWALWRRPVLGFLGGWFFVILLPTSSLVPLAGAIAAEHRMYLPSISPVALVVALGFLSLERVGTYLAWPVALRGAVAVGLVAACAVLLGARTLRRNTDFSSESRLWVATLAADPENPRAHNNLGGELLEQGDLDAAIREYQAALASDPNYAAAHLNLVSVLMRKGRPAEAREHLDASLRLDPGNATAHLELGRMQRAAGSLAAATASLREAVRLQPDLATAHEQLARVLLEQTDYRGAVAEFRATLALEPQRPATLTSLAWLLATCPEEAVRNGAEAVRWAEQAVNAGRGSDPDALETLAAAYAEAGHFDAAIATETRAHELALGSGRADRAERRSARLALYRAHLPFHSAAPQSTALPRP